MVRKRGRSRIRRATPIRRWRRIRRGVAISSVRVLAGALLTTGVTCAAVLLGYRYLKLPFAAVMGMTSGIHTQPACLAYANERANNEMPNTWYATVYPASMIAKIILAQIIVSTLLTLVL